jgi:hypothetical protein
VYSSGSISANLTAAIMVRILLFFKARRLASLVVVLDSDLVDLILGQSGIGGTFRGVAEDLATRGPNRCASRTKGDAPRGSLSRAFLFSEVSGGD